jgi:threonine dehydratase
MTKATAEAISAARKVVYQTMPPTPTHSYPLLNAKAGVEVFVKHENHTPVGAFKVRGGLNFMAGYKADGNSQGVITATRGNHGQSIAFAASRAGVEATIVVPEGNSVEKNAAMEALGGKLIVHGHDFQAAAEYAAELAKTEGLYMLPSFDERLVAGVATYAMELFEAAPNLDAVYAPIGLGSGICGIISARDALGLKTEIVGVVSEGAPCYALSFDAGAPISTNSADTMADGMACRTPVAAAVETINAGVARIVRVSDAEIGAAMAVYYSDTHNIAEGAGAAPLAALMQEKDRMAGKRAGVVLSGGNIDRSLYLATLAGQA